MPGPEPGALPLGQSPILKPFYPSYFFDSSTNRTVYHASNIKIPILNHSSHAPPGTLRYVPPSPVSVCITLAIAVRQPIASQYPAATNASTPENPLMAFESCIPRRYGSAKTSATAISAATRRPASLSSSTHNVVRIIGNFSNDASCNTASTTNSTASEVPRAIVNARSRCAYFAAM